MQFDKLSALLNKIEVMKEEECFGQLTVFIEPNNVGAAFQQLVLFRECPDNVKQALQVVANHFKTQKLEIRCDMSKHAPEVKKILALRLNF